VLRLVAMVCGSAAVLASTPTEQFTTLMRTLRLPNALVFMCTTALRFVPTLRQRARQITDAQQVRGARISSGGLVRRIKAHATVMIPLLTSGIRMSEDLAAAMVSRGYGITRHPTRLHDLSWSWRDTLLAAAAIALLAVPLVTG
jgi:cobalt transport protein